VELATRTLVFDRGGIQLDGANRVRFTYPRADNLRFSSPLLNDRNYELSGGGPWREVIGRVVRGQKPVGFVDSSDPELMEEHAGVVEPSPDPMRDAARMALDGGRCVLLHSVTFDDDAAPITFCSASLSGRLRDVFDLEALISDYRAYTAAAGPDAADGIAEELRLLADADVSEFLDFRVIEGDRELESTAADWARRGLLFGYPVDTTAALVCETLGVPGCGSEYVD
jgi:hypothetical protein